jgi:HD-GYP domain-containing protein (c-di-GMP phosphodiesterase class II)
MLVTRMGLEERVGVLVGASFERWDGKGLPGEQSGEEIPMPARVVAVARDVEVLHRLGGDSMVTEALQRRAGKAYDPAIVAAATKVMGSWLVELEEVAVDEATLDAEPEPRVFVEAGNMERVLGAFADFADMKTPFTLGHSPRVAALAAEAAGRAGLPADEVADVRSASLVHDLGKAGVPNGLLEKRGPLSTSEWERVRLHPYLTERILSQSPVLARLAPLAGSHHERLDGSGYHRGVREGELSTGARILAAANTYVALGEERPYRPAVDEETRAQTLQGEAQAGRLDPGAVLWVLEAAGQSAPGRQRAWPNGLTDREVEVLRLVARGESNRSVAEQLVISPKTVGRHVENVYNKINVSSRAAAALFALQHDLLND